MKKVFIIILILLVSGCKHNDINEESIVTSLYIDKNMNCLYIIPNEKDSYLDTIEGKGTTLYEMFNNIKNKSDKKLYFNHLTTIIISENITYEELSSFIEKAMLPSRANIVLAKNIDKIIKEQLKLAPFETPTSTLISKNVTLVSYKNLKENTSSYLPFIGYDDKTIFIGYKKIQF